MIQTSRVRAGGASAGRGRRLLASLALCWIALSAACTGGSAPRSAPTGRDAPITIASFDFTESEILANLYAGALAAKGFPVRLLPNAGTRELLEPALASGLVDLIPEYAGSAVSFLTLGAAHPTPDVSATHAALLDAVASSGAVALAPSPAQDANAVVVTSDTARRFGLTSIGDLALEAPVLKFGGPPECEARPLCLRGLEERYGLHFGQFVPLDTGGELTRQALLSGGIDVALLFTTDPAISARSLVVLEDDRGLQPAENITPVVRRAVLARYGPAFAGAVDAVSAALSTVELRTLVGRVTMNGEPVGQVAASWLKDEGLA